MSDMSRTQSEVGKYQKQVASGQEVTHPEDNPGAAADATQRMFEKQVIRQYYDNAVQLKEKNTAAFQAVQGLSDNSDRVGETLSFNGRMTDKDQLRAFAQELNGLVDTAVQIVNQKHLGKSLFAGAKLNEDALATTVVDGQVTAVTYQGEGHVGAVKVSEATQMHALPPASDCEKFKEYIDHIIALRDAFQAEPDPDYDAIDALRQPLIKDSNNIIKMLGDLGAKESRLNYTQEVNQDAHMAADKSMADNTETNPIDKSIKLNASMNSLELGIAGGNSLIQLMRRLTAFLN